jgi:hypothetical protein
VFSRTKIESSQKSRYEATKQIAKNRNDRPTHHEDQTARRKQGRRRSKSIPTNITRERFQAVISETRKAERDKDSKKVSAKREQRNGNYNQSPHSHQGQSQNTRNSYRTTRNQQDEYTNPNQRTHGGYDSRHNNNNRKSQTMAQAMTRQSGGTVTLPFAYTLHANPFCTVLHRCPTIQDRKSHHQQAQRTEINLGSYFNYMQYYSDAVKNEQNLTETTPRGQSSHQTDDATRTIKPPNRPTSCGRARYHQVSTSRSSGSHSATPHPPSPRQQQ